MAQAHPVSVCTQHSAAIPLLPSLLPDRKENPQEAFLKGLGDSGKECTGVPLHLQKFFLKNHNIKKNPVVFFFVLLLLVGWGGCLFVCGFLFCFLGVFFPLEQDVASPPPPCHSPNLRFGKTQAKEDTADTAPWIPSAKFPCHSSECLRLEFHINESQNHRMLRLGKTSGVITISLTIMFTTKPSAQVSHHTFFEHFQE